MDPRPTPEDIKKRALEMIEEAMAYPEEARERLLDIKRAAIGSLVAKPDPAVLEKYYPGWIAEDLKALMGFLPAARRSKDDWHL